MEKEKDDNIKEDKLIIKEEKEKKLSDNDDKINNENVKVEIKTDERKSEIPLIEKVDENDLNKGKEEKLLKDNKKKRYFGLDLIRVLACYLVMQTHVGELYYIGENGEFLSHEKNIWPAIFNSLSRVCVPLFIMISGYLLLPMKTDYKTFLKRRFTRISSPFFIFCVFYDIYFYIIGKIELSDMFLNIPKIFINYGTEIGHLWYIYMIMGIYLYIPIISPWIRTAEKSHFYYYFIIWFITLFSKYIHLKFPEIWGECYWNNTSTFQSFIGNFGYAILGAFIKLHLQENNFYIFSIFCYILGSGGTMFGFLYKRHEVDKVEDVEISWNFNNVNVAVATFGVFMILRKIECNNEKVSWIINDIALKSYGMYLIHIFFLFLFKYIFDITNGYPIWCIFVIPSLVFILSYLSIKAISYIPYSEYLIG